MDFAVVKKGQPSRYIYFLEDGVCQMRSGNNVLGYLKPGEETITTYLRSSTHP